MLSVTCTYHSLCVPTAHWKQQHVDRPYGRYHGPLCGLSSCWRTELENTFCKVQSISLERAGVSDMYNNAQCVGDAHHHLIHVFMTYCCILLIVVSERHQQTFAIRSMLPTKISFDSYRHILTFLVSQLVEERYLIAFVCSHVRKATIFFQAVSVPPGLLKVNF